MKILKDMYRTYKAIRYRNEIANINTQDLIQANFESALAVFKGFFGQPYYDNDLMTANKNILIADGRRKLNGCSVAIQSFGFELLSSRSRDGQMLKVIMIPNSSIRRHLTSRSIGNESKEVIQLYRSLGGDVV